MRWLFSLALALSVSCAAVAEETWSPAKTYVLMVGVLDWKSGELAKFPKEHRQDRVLEAALQRAGVPASQIVFLEDRQATLAAMRAQLSGLAKRAGSGSTLFFYYAGHGILEGRETYFANYDIDPQQAARTGFSVGELGRALAAHWKGQRLILMADACYSGALARVAASEGRRGKLAASLTSATASNESTGSWTFTESLIKIFAGSGWVDENQDGRLTFAETDRFVHREMKYNEDQLAHAFRTPAFAEGFVLRPVDPRLVKPQMVTKSPFAIGDYVECQSKGSWYRAQIIGQGDQGLEVRFPGYGPEWNEWVDQPGRLRSVRLGDFRVGEKIRVAWEGEWYPARILKVEDDFFYLIHYDDYGAEWDEWVSASRMRRGP